LRSNSNSRCQGIELKLAEERAKAEVDVFAEVKKKSEVEELLEV